MHLKFGVLMFKEIIERLKSFRVRNITFFFVFFLQSFEGKKENVRLLGKSSKRRLLEKTFKRRLLGKSKRRHLGKWEP
ncbi:hypothetical protein IGI04_007415 [Brassica rapa subsp. trilocularis]|uniref:Uncharacterized protein n=1 Tax=Brassica rapa subsp. trilocularis TaxID=1813537 RepID=A0ABQ7NLQ5_BRACM|nr:hypothetical protein IGI04_007415 [Brassica rapa subsp. trilocularis]